METTYTWIIEQMQCKQQEGELTDVVIKVNWIRKASATKDGIEYSVTIPGIQDFTQPDPENFIPYDQLTYEQVCGWLEESMNMTMIDTPLYNQLNLIVNPPLIVLPLPWEPTTTTTTSTTTTTTTEDPTTSTTTTTTTESI
jgi:hypothetical protein